MDEGCVEVPISSPPRSPKKESVDDRENASGNSSPSGRSSPEANCPICLGRPENKSFTDSCLHQFCFTCLQEWSKVKAECPLCKQSFKSIIHNVRSIEDYDQYQIRQATNEARTFTLQIREPFRYRTTSYGSGGTVAYLEFHQRLQHSMFGAVLPSGPSHSSTVHWHRRRQEGTSDFRRNVYQQGLWVQRLRDVTGRVRDCTPEFYRANPAATHRLVPWLNRELNVLCNDNRHHTEWVLNRILDLINQMPIRSPAFTAAVAPYIGRHTEHFVHEFYNYASSPFDLIGYDRNANYVNRNDIAHDPYHDSNDSEDSDVQIVGQYAVSPPSIHVASDSDECVVVDQVAPPPPAVEVITLDTDPEDTAVQVSIQINTDHAQPGPSSGRLSRRSRPVKLKRNWLLKNSQESTSGNFNVSINIAHGSQSRCSSTSSSDSSASWNPKRKSKMKKKEKPKKCLKGKGLKSKKKSKPVKSRSSSPVIVSRRRRSSLVLQTSSSEEEIKVNEEAKRRRQRSNVYLSTSSEEDSEAHNNNESKYRPIHESCRLQQSAVRRPSSEDDDLPDIKLIPSLPDSTGTVFPRSSEEPNNGEPVYDHDVHEVKQEADDDDDSERLHIVTDYSSSSSEEYKPRLRSVVVKSTKQPKLEVTSDGSNSMSRPQSPAYDIDSNTWAPVPRSEGRSLALDNAFGRADCSTWYRPPPAASSHRDSTSSECSHKKSKHCKKRWKKINC